MAECGICYEMRPFTTLSCGHDFCAQCVRKQLRFNARCAFCRSTFKSTSPALAEYTSTAHRLLRIDSRPRGTRWGITVVSADKDCDGVRVTKVSRGPLRKAGLRCGARILTINGIPCYLHTVTIQILRALMWDGCAVNFVVDERHLEPRKLKSWHCVHRLKLWRAHMIHRVQVGFGHARG